MRIFSCEGIWGTELIVLSDSLNEHEWRDFYFWLRKGVGEPFHLWRRSFYFATCKIPVGSISADLKILLWQLNGCLTNIWCLIWQFLSRVPWLVVRFSDQFSGTEYMTLQNWFLNWDRTLIKYSLLVSAEINYLAVVWVQTILFHWEINWRVACCVFSCLYRQGGRVN